jgi:hypothetical protein
MLSKASAVFATALLGLSLYSGGDVKDLAKSLPREILDWKVSGDDAVYDKTTIYDYLDGGAEVYLAFDFQAALARKYAGPNGDEIALDIYDMGSPEEAFGVFSCDRQDEDAGIGQESEYGAGLLRFRRGRYFVSITALGDENASGKAIIALGKAAAESLGPDGPVPAMLDLLPSDGLVRDRTSYFHSVINLNNRYFVAGENILNLDKGQTDCALAEYAVNDEETGKLLAIRYPDEGSARAARESFLRGFLPEAGPDGAALTENREWTLARQSGRFLFVVFEAPSAKWAEDLASAAAALGK